MSADYPSEWRVELIEVGAVQKLPNSDRLEMTLVHGGYPVIFQTGQFKQGDLAVYVPVESLVPTDRPEFQFLAKPGYAQHRVRAVRLRGTFSMGLLVSPPTAVSDWAMVGELVHEAMGIVRWEPPQKGEAQPGGSVRNQARNPEHMPIYGVEAYRRHTDVLREGEHVVILEKLHGANARFCFTNGRLWVGSHRTIRGVSKPKWRVLLSDAWWKLRVWAGGRKPKPGVTDITSDVWHEVAAAYGLQEKFARYPDHTFYGEVIGPGIQDLTYGRTNKGLVVFDIFSVREERFLEYDDVAEICERLDLSMPPCLYRGAWRPDLLQLAEGRSKYIGADHIREGFVVRAVPERRDVCGRVALKVVGETYLLRQ